MTGTVADVEVFYNAFPYPTVSSLSHALPPSFKRGALDYLLRRRATERLPPDARIWVAGCGTQQALHWALCFPEGEVLGTDISGASLACARSLGEQLGLRNLRLEAHDLTKGPVEGRFDLVVSTGVIHHLPEPAEGLAHLHTALAPSGAMVLMVYSRMHREALAVLRQSVEALVGAESSLDERYDLACRILEAQLDSPRCSPLAREALELLRSRKDKDRASVADCLIHPLEHYYDVDGLLSLLAGAGLRHTSWLRPAAWELESYIEDTDLLARFAALAPAERWRTVFNLAGHAGPLLEVVCEPIEGPERTPYALDELLGMRFVCRRSERIIRVEETRIRGHATVPSYQREGGKLVAGAPGPFGGRERWSISADAEPLLRAFDGESTLGDVVERFDDEFGAEAIVGLVARLSPSDIGLLAP